MNILKFCVCFLLLVFSSASYAEEWKFSAKDFISTSENNGVETYSLNLEVVNYYLKKIEAHAFRYPPRFKDAKERRFIESQLIDLIKVLQIVDNSKSKDADFLWRYGWALAMAHNLDRHGERDSGLEAIKIFERSLAIDPENIHSNYLYGVFLSGTALKDKSIPYLEKSIHTMSDAKYILASVYVAHKKTWPKAKKLLEEYTREYPQDKEALQMLEALKQGKISYVTVD